MTTAQLNETIESVRRFNRFHTKLVGALNEGLLSSKFPLVQVRVLYELAHGTGLAAADLVESLQVDAGYLSRMITALEKHALIEKSPDGKNAKRNILSLTDTGVQLYEKLNAASAEEVRALVEPLKQAERKQLVGSMQRIERLLDGRGPERNYLLRDPEPGDLGWVIHRQSAYYAQEFGWDWSFEGLVSGIVADYVKNHDPGCERCWIAEMEGDIVGCVFIVRQDRETAKLRMLYVDADARGMGLGRRLVEECIRFASRKKYKRMVLWTNSILLSARRIYEATGFQLIEEEPHGMFGKDLTGQTWSLDL